MASCLYECLCEAGLEQYFSHFTAVGVLRTQELARISMDDYSALGIHDMHDRKRLFQLIQIIKAVQEEEEERAIRKAEQAQEGISYPCPQAARSGPRRQLNFDPALKQKNGTCASEFKPYGLSGLSLPAYAHEDGFSELPGHTLPGDQTNIKHSGREMPGGNTVYMQRDVGCPTSVLPNGNAGMLGDVEPMHMQRITCDSGYNYGVPHSYSRQNSEKERAWTETDKIRVCVRKRPLGVREERRGEADVVMVKDQKSVLIHEKKEAVDLTQYILQHVFYFDEVFDEACTNQDVYLKTAYPLIQHVFNGGKATCFAYGQTGAGKTHTMIGTPQNPGLYALAAKDIFRQLEVSQHSRGLLIWISFYEIYCGQLYDLLNGKKKLFAREDANHVVQIVGLCEIQVVSVESMLEVILHGSRERSTGATGVNSDSSRSHAIIQIQVKDLANRVFGRISFIDLAGSERAADAKDSDKQTKIEGAEINQSLLALKECIRALDQEHSHTPFRQSKLTQVLKDSFIGNSKTCMIANVSPSHIATEHTLNTLRYADRVKELKRGVKQSTIIAGKAQVIRSPSPKRNKNPSSAAMSSPKKVKLGIHSPQNAVLHSARPKFSPSAFHPTNIPLCSTPKAYLKKPVSQENPGPNAPFKGTLKTECPGMKKNLYPTEPVDRLFGDKVCVFQGSPDSVVEWETRKVEYRQADAVLLQDNSVRNQKVQAVQPVQKENVSRDALCFYGKLTKQHCLSEEGSRAQVTGSSLSSRSSEFEMDVHLHQKEREKHLRLYHQQLQQLHQPPILQQKLQYQPLEDLLLRYRPQEIMIKDGEQLTCAAWSVLQDGRQPKNSEGHDESNQDLLSYVQSQGPIDGSDSTRKALYHCREVTAEGEEEEVIGRENLQNLLLKYGRRSGQEHSIRWHDQRPQVGQYTFGNGRGKYENEHDSTENLSDWSTEEDYATFGSSESNNTSEKRYFLKEVNEEKLNNLSANRKQTNLNPVQQIKRDVDLSLAPEKECNAFVLNILGAVGSEGQERSACPYTAPAKAKRIDPQLSKERIAREEQLSRGKKRQEASDISAESVGGIMAPLTLSLLDGERTAVLDDSLYAEKLERLLPQGGASSPRTFSPGQAVLGNTHIHGHKNLESLASQSLGSECGRELKECSPPQLEKQWRLCLQNDAKTSEAPAGSLEVCDTSSSSAHQGSVDDPFEQAVNCTVCGTEISSEGQSDVSLIREPLCLEAYSGSRQYEADAEDSHLAPLGLGHSKSYDGLIKAEAKALLRGEGSQSEISVAVSEHTSTDMGMLEKSSIADTVAMGSDLQSQTANILRRPTEERLKEGSCVQAETELRCDGSLEESAVATSKRFSEQHAKTASSRKDALGIFREILLQDAHSQHRYAYAEKDTNCPGKHSTEMHVASASHNTADKVAVDSKEKSPKDHRLDALEKAHTHGRRWIDSTRD
ncbi:kinesin-like protein KIF24 isoform X2 [Latimeria chalumnae]|uniref:kinesin-like protein KIF24 isoform X2 n=1 Tax=Latimeria chalumnae TaxID=7897 RepID=UPI00313E9F0E